MRLYYATDLHGSEKCWKKFIAAAKYYQADVLVMGGDITGKFIVPFISMPKGRVEATFMGQKRVMKKEADVERLKQQVINTGQYPVDMTPEEFETYNNNPGLLDELFKKLLYERVEQWMKYADEKLRGQNVRVFVTAGNDDLFEIDEAIAKSKIIVNHDGKIIDLGEGFEMFGMGYANITPWHCPRDIPEEELAAKIESVAKNIKNPERAIFDIHVPPYDTEIDSAPELTEKLQMVMSATGTPKMKPVGSTAVREILLKYQPMLGLHGHIHESAGIRKLGRTTIVNPGSEYAEGILRGALVELDAKQGLVSVNLVAG